MVSKALLVGGCATVAVAAGVAIGVATSGSGNPAPRAPVSMPHDQTASGRTVVVPSLTGQSASDPGVRSLLATPGLTFDVVKHSSSIAPVGVIDQVSPPPGSTVPIGSTVTVTVSTGPSS